MVTCQFWQAEKIDCFLNQTWRRSRRRGGRGRETPHGVIEDVVWVVACAPNPEEVVEIEIIVATEKVISHGCPTNNGGRCWTRRRPSIGWRNPASSGEQLMNWMRWWLYRLSEMPLMAFHMSYPAVEYFLDLMQDAKITTCCPQCFRESVNNKLIQNKKTPLGYYITMGKKLINFEFNAWTNRKKWTLIPVFFLWPVLANYSSDRTIWAETDLIQLALGWVRTILSNFYLSFA